MGSHCLPRANNPLVFEAGVCENETVVCTSRLFGTNVGKDACIYDLYVLSTLNT